MPQTLSYPNYFIFPQKCNFRKTFINLEGFFAECVVVVNSNEDKWKDPLTTREFVWEMFGSQGRDGKATIT